MENDYVRTLAALYFSFKFSGRGYWAGYAYLATNFLTRAPRSKGRISPFIFQVVASLPEMRQIVYYYKTSQPIAKLG
jgi:hypothetical protein